ncbi:MAG TPA: glycosyltransferase family 2 protein [Xanthobacteraceae bacterium]|nr:glycosyltransferase family 2 protein [Xanthobacteraceae bacterium]
MSIVVPTFNERDNVRELVARLDRCLQGTAWEVMFVDDDSRDGTIDVLRSLSRSDPRVRFLHRIGRRGLASAVVEGILATAAPFIAVLDCDLQHDETVLPLMLEKLRSGGCDVVVASRYMAAGGTGNWAKQRLFVSRVATRLANFVLPSELTDPMSGFFMIDRAAFDHAVRKLSNQGYKILLDILLSAQPSLRVEEVPYTFRSRVKGESKLDTTAILDYLALLIDKLIGHVIPLRFIMFVSVGGMGLIVHLGVLATLNRGFGVAFALANLCAAMVAVTFNFFVNNLVTYRDMRLKGFWPVLRGLVSFAAVCGLGTAANIGIAVVLFQRDYTWWLAGLAGILMGAVWNYTATSIFTWRKAGAAGHQPAAPAQDNVLAASGATISDVGRP